MQQGFFFTAEHSPCPDFRVAVMERNNDRHFYNGISEGQVFNEDLQFLCAAALAHSFARSFSLGREIEIIEHYLHTQRTASDTPQRHSPSLSRNNTEFPRNLQDLHWLMEAAHKPGNGMYLAKVKALCAEAHSTPRERKTELQKVLLSMWRNPVPLGFAQVSLRNPRIDDPVEYDYLCTHQKSWLRGVRKDLWGRPIMSDLRANRIISRLRPETGLEPSSSKSVTSRTFVQQAVNLFSRPGAYQWILVGNDIDVAHSLSYLRFHECTWPITIEDIVRHFATCGITVEMAKLDFEPWARNYLETSFFSPLVRMK